MVSSLYKLNDITPVKNKIITTGPTDIVENITVP